MQVKEVTDSAVAWAAQTGRLDLVTVALAVLTIILGLGAIPVFLMLKSRAAEVAREAADEKLKGAEKRVEELAIAKLEALLPSLVDDYMQLAKNAVSAEIGDEIAKSVSEEGAVKPHAGRRRNSKGSKDLSG